MILQSSRHFLVFYKIGGEGNTPGTRGVLAECPGWSPGNAFTGNVVLPGGIPGGLMARDTWHSRTSTRDTWLTRNAPGGFFWRGHSGHVAYSQCSRRVLSAWAFGTRGVLGRLPDGVSRLRHSGHVACSEGFRRVALGVGFGDTWHSLKVSQRGLSVWLS